MICRALLLLSLVTACSAGSADANAQQNGEADRTSAKVARPANAPPSGVNDVIGATPGPCGSTRATEFLGRTYRPDMDAALMRSSGADEIRLNRPIDADAPETPMNERRLNLLLNDSGQIILLDCG